MKACVIIPARFASSRFPGKPLAKLNGKEMILWVAENCSKAVNASNVYIATDDKKISDLVIKKGLTRENNVPLMPYAHRETICRIVSFY